MKTCFPVPVLQLDREIYDLIQSLVITTTTTTTTTKSKNKNKLLGSKTKPHQEIERD